jgi:hypothetical protein
MALSLKLSKTLLRSPKRRAKSTNMLTLPPLEVV